MWHVGKNVKLYGDEEVEIKDVCHDIVNSSFLEPNTKSELEKHENFKEKNTEENK